MDKFSTNGNLRSFLLLQCARKLGTCIGNDKIWDLCFKLLEYLGKRGEIYELQIEIENTPQFLLSPQFLYYTQKKKKKENSIYLALIFYLEIGLVVITRQFLVRIRKKKST